MFPKEFSWLKTLIYWLKFPKGPICNKTKLIQVMPCCLQTTSHYLKQSCPTFMFLYSINRSQWLTHWGRVMHICVSNLTIIVPDNGLLPDRHQAIIWPNAGILLIRTSGTNFSEILSEIHIFSFKNIHLKILSAQWRPFCLSLNVLIWVFILAAILAWKSDDHMTWSTLPKILTTDTIQFPCEWIYRVIFQAECLKYDLSLKLSQCI